MNSIYDIPLVLASQSPRRKEILEACGFQFKIIIENCDENYPPGLSSKQVAEFLAQKKAKACLKHIKESEVIIAADSIVLIDEKILGKPVNKTEAEVMLKQLSGRCHEVITGVCLLSKTRQRTFSGTSIVHMNNLDSKEIEYYIENFKPFDKAGSYGVQEWIGFCKISRIEGTYSNVMGLPANLVYEELKGFMT